MDNKIKQTILSIDLGTSTGWALYDGLGGFTSGTVSFKPKRFEGGGMRYLRFSRWLNEVIAISGKPDSIYFEEVRRHLGVDAAHAYGGFLSTLTCWCENNHIPYEGIPVGTIKKFISGKGNANKQQVIDEIKKRGHMPNDDNEADALALLYLAIENYSN
jgi:Holliday junction resolvasome RuvABC endonuclease subunit